MLKSAGMFLSVAKCGGAGQKLMERSCMENFEIIIAKIRI